QQRGNESGEHHIVLRANSSICSPGILMRLVALLDERSPRSINLRTVASERFSSTAASLGCRSVSLWAEFLSAAQVGLHLHAGSRFHFERHSGIHGAGSRTGVEPDDFQFVVSCRDVGSVLPTNSTDLSLNLFA